jgi:hypothetical protein
MDNITLSDIKAVTGEGNSGAMCGGWIWIIVLFLFMFGFNGNGFGANRNDAVSNEILSNQHFNALDARITNLGNGICDSTYALNNSILTEGRAMQTQLAQCCCETNRNIDAVRYENAKNTCDITHNAQLNTRDILESQNAGFQRILDFLTTDKIDSLRSELQSAQLQLGNMSQTTNLINSLRPYPTPAYITASPYTSAYGGCGCGI